MVGIYAIPESVNNFRRGGFCWGDPTEYGGELEDLLHQTSPPIVQIWGDATNLLGRYAYLGMASEGFLGMESEGFLATASQRSLTKTANPWLLLRHLKRGRGRKRKRLEKALY